LQVLEEVAGRKARVRKLPRGQGDPMRTAADLSRAAADLGYRPDVPVEEALRRQAEWYAGPAGPLAMERARR
jgi:nucleoside-diphosphate-sugar epimerase